jgi:hypothetical protein
VCGHTARTFQLHGVLFPMSPSARKAPMTSPKCKGKCTYFGLALNALLTAQSRFVALLSLPRRPVPLRQAGRGQSRTRRQLRPFLIDGTARHGRAYAGPTIKQINPTQKNSDVSDVDGHAGWWCKATGIICCAVSRAPGDYFQGSDGCSSGEIAEKLCQPPCLAQRDSKPRHSHSGHIEMPDIQVSPRVRWNPRPPKTTESIRKEEPWELKKERGKHRQTTESRGTQGKTNQGKHLRSRASRGRRTRSNSVSHTYQPRTPQPSRQNQRKTYDIH